jgi:hypothetical protein
MLTALIDKVVPIEACHLGGFQNYHPCKVFLMVLSSVGYEEILLKSGPVLTVGA